MSERALPVQLNGVDMAVHATQARPAEVRLPRVLQVDARPDGDRMIVVVSGEIDVDTEQPLQRALQEALGRSASGVDLDLSGVRFCDCSGLNNVLLRLRLRLRVLERAKTVVIQAVGPVVERLLTLTDTSSLLAPALLAPAGDRDGVTWRKTW
jgi:anti-anti-sigma factor